MGLFKATEWGKGLGIFQFNTRQKQICFITVAALTFASQDFRAADYYAAPRGGSGGDGSASRPWDLQTALNQPRKVKPGDTIWLRGGVYRKNNRATKYYSTISGEPNQPITVRQFPGERAVIDGNITQVTGGRVNYWGFEIMNSIRHRQTPENGPFPKAFWLLDGPGKVTDFAVSGFDVRVPHVKLINMIIHDSVGGGIGISSSAANPEIYGTLCFYNGWQGGDRGHGHGIYAQSAHPSVCRIEESLFFANYALGLQATGNGPVVDNFHVEGNVFFFNSALSYKHQGNLLIGSGSDVATGITLVRNFIYQTQPSGTDCNIGYVRGIWGGRVEQNYFATKVSLSANNKDVKTQDNTIIQEEKPTQYPNMVEVRPNRYEEGRAHIVVFNWEQRNELSVDLNAVLAPGTSYEIRNAQDVLGPPILRNVYNGGLISLPMTNLFVARPRAAEIPASTAPEFNVFLVIPNVNGTKPVNSAPIVSGITSRTIKKNESPQIRVTVQDKETPADLLNLSVRSSDPKLIPYNNIKFGGTETSRTITITPATDQSGKCTISLAVSDGNKATIRSFMLTVTP